MECDASKIDIRAVLKQKKQLIVYSTKKLNDAAFNYPTYNKELHVFVRTIKT